MTSATNPRHKCRANLGYMYLVKSAHPLGCLPGSAGNHMRVSSITGFKGIWIAMETTREAAKKMQHDPIMSTVLSLANMTGKYGCCSRHYSLNLTKPDAKTVSAFCLASRTASHKEWDEEVSVTMEDCVEWMKHCMDNYHYYPCHALVERWAWPTLPILEYFITPP